MLNDPDGNPNNYRPLPQYSDLIVHPALPLSELQRVPVAAQPVELEVQLYGGLYVLEGARHSRRRTGGGTVAHCPPTSGELAYGILGYDRTHVLNIGYSYLLPDFEDTDGRQPLLGDGS